MSAHTCQHCGAGISFAAFPRRQQQIYDLIRANPGITPERIIRQAYADDIDGGPHWVTIRTHVWKLNKHLAKEGLRIVGDNRGCSSGYRLATIK